MITAETVAAETTATVSTTIGTKGKAVAMASKTTETGGFLKW
jgi:hypothetical protein